MNISETADVKREKVIQLLDKFVPKFRAWDGRRMIFISEPTIGLEKSKSPKPYMYFKKDTFNGEVSLCTHRLMLCSPWPDMDGNDVYAGDIIETIYEDKMEEEGYGVIRNLIDFREGAFKWLGESTGKWHELIEYDMKEAKVVGNVFENPELLEDRI